jgi:membrane-associated phospholipid phosphatase
MHTLSTIKLSVGVVCLATVSVAGVCSAQTAAAQTVAAPPGDESAPLSTIASVPPAPAPATPSLFRSMARDVPNFFSSDTAKVLTVFALGGLTAHSIDRASVEDTSEHLSRGFASVGNTAGGLYVQAGAGLAAYAIGRATGNPAVASLGGDLVRAQALTQLFVQGAKFAVGRQRPDASNSLSFPSGHAASTFATATVLQQHFGWKAGVPAYTFASFVAASRMASSKHYFSDVVVGAGLGIAAGRTVTLHLGGDQFAIGAAPAQGGAMVTFTKRD